MYLVIVQLLVAGILLLLVGYLLPFIDNKKISRAIGWSLTIAVMIYAAIVVAGESAVIRMFALISLLMLAMKMLVVNEAYTSVKLSFVQWCAFASGWFGMKPVLFERLISKPLNDNGLFLKGASAVIVGTIFLWISKIIDLKSSTYSWLADLFILIGISLILHFGVLNLSTSFWRALGVNVTALFKSPYKARSLSEFWSKRWNIAFSEMTAIIIYRPLASKFGKTASLVTAFLFSGVLHEIAISVPVNARYGLPFLYFLIHAIAMYAENHLALIKSMLSNRIASHIWVFMCTILPSPLLFHEHFINEVLRPLRDIMVSIIL